jgi:hypothetical protein
MDTSQRVTGAEHLMLCPIANWPRPAIQAARQLIETPTGLQALRATRHKKAWVVQYVAATLGKEQQSWQ